MCSWFQNSHNYLVQLVQSNQINGAVSTENNILKSYLKDFIKAPQFNFVSLSWLHSDENWNSKFSIFVYFSHFQFHLLRFSTHTTRYLSISVHYRASLIRNKYIWEQTKALQVKFGKVKDLVIIYDVSHKRFFTDGISHHPTLSFLSLYSFGRFCGLTFLTFLTMMFTRDFFPVSLFVLRFLGKNLYLL